MRLASLVVLSICCGVALATSPPEQVPLTSALAESLGFEVQVGADSEYLQVAIDYPPMLYGCLEPSATRFIVEDESEKFVSAVVTELSPGSLDPRVLALFDPSKGRGIVRISYACVIENIFECEYPWGVDYVVESVEEFHESL